jgi:hypothetical protein
MISLTIDLQSSILFFFIQLNKLGNGQLYFLGPTHDAESGLLSLCTAHFLLLLSDSAVTSSALAIRIVFPLVGVPSGFSRLGLPGMAGKQKAWTIMPKVWGLLNCSKNILRLTKISSIDSGHD